MPRFGLVGPSYTAQSSQFACEQAINVYCETAETPNGGKGGSRMMLVKIPGLAVTHTLPDYPVRCLYSGDNNRLFCVSGSTLYELFTDGTYSELGIVQPATTPAQILSNGSQLFVVSGSHGYIADGVNVEQVVDCCMGGYIDGYFLALEGTYPGSSKTFRISELLNGKSWPDLDFANVDQTPDNVQAMIVDHNQVMFFKQQTSEGYWDSGNVDFPIVPIQGAFVEQGCIAPWTPKRIDNTLMWLGGDERGAGMVWRMQGYTPTRVSNFAIENAIQGYTRAGITITDAVSMVEQSEGHNFYHLSFPSANATWTYDCATGLWHQRASWDAANGVWNCHKARYHAYCQGTHYVGGGDGTGKVYAQGVQYQDDAGNPLRWLRQTPHIADPATRMIFYSNLVVDCQVGVGIDTLVDVDGLPRQPVMTVRHSNDGGNTWNPETQLAMGKQGQYSYRARQPLCGSGRNRVIELSGTDPVELAICEGWIDFASGTS